MLNKMQKNIALLLTVFVLALFVVVPTAQAASLLKVGSQGQEVATLQANLNKLGFNAGNVDGIFGAKTKAAVQSFQKSAGIGVDGIVGPQTNAALAKALNAQAANPSSSLLRQGSRGQAVATLQANLNKLGYNAGNVDGIFGAKTKAAVLAFQRNQGLAIDGIVGPQTQSAINKALNNNTGNTGNTSSRTAKTNAIIATAKSLTGVPYVWGGTTTKGFDCSGFTQYVYAKHGITLPRVSRDQYKVGSAVSFNALAPGDLVFFSLQNNGVVDHVGIYLGNNQFISATSSKGVITYSFTPYWKNGYIGAKRVY